MIAVAWFSCLVLASCSEKPDVQTGTIGIVASIAPLADFARQVAGDRAEVFTLLPAGTNPHTFELTPVQLERISRADLLVVNGAGLEYWLPKLQAVGDLRVCTTSDRVDLIDEGHEGHANPHVWLDPVAAVTAVEHIRDALAAADTAHADEYRANAARYVDSLRALDGLIRSTASHWRTRSFVAYHASWVYFARRYGLNQAAAIESSPGHEIAPRQYRRIIELMRGGGVRVVVAETVSPLKPAETLARETGAVMVVLDPAGTTTPSYLAMMRANLASLDKAMR